MSMQACLASFTLPEDRDGRVRYGYLSDAGIVDLSVRFSHRWSSLETAVSMGALEEMMQLGERMAPDFALADACLEVPITTPEKIICVGVNYPARNEEYNDGKDAPPNPSLFPRFRRSFTGHDRPLIRPNVSTQLDYEGEIVLVIGKPGRHIPEASALEHVAALTLCNEGSVRDWLRHAKFNVTQGKNFDASGAMGPGLVPFSGEAQIADIRLETRVNGETRQSDRTGRMLFGFRRLINYISTFTTLMSGDMIVTGTPTGAGARFDPPKWLVPGDVIEVEAEGIGLLRNTVADEAAR